MAESTEQQPTEGEEPAAGAEETPGVTPLADALPTELGSGTSSVREYDLTSRAKTLGGMPGLDIINERFATAFKRTLSSALRQSCDIQTISTEVITFADFIMQVPRPTGLFVFRLAPLPGGCAVVVDGHLLRALIDAFCGGKEMDLTQTESPGERDLTGIELRLLRRLSRPMESDMSEAWQLVVPIDPDFDRIVVRPELSRLADEPESVIFSVFEIQVGDYRSPLAIILPISTIEPIKERLLRVSHVPGEVRGSQLGQQIVEHLPEVEVEMTVELGRAKVDLRTLVGLKPGDVIRLDTSSTAPLTATVEGHPKFRGQAQASGSALMFHVDQRITDQ